MNIKHCKICGEAEFGPLHILERQLEQIITEKAHLERMKEINLAKYWADREDAIRRELFNRAKFSDCGYHDFMEEDNLDTIERLAKEKGFV